MKKIKAVIFDLDGTLGNTLPLCIKAFKKSIEPLLNRVISDEEIISTFGPSEEGTIMTLALNYFDKGVRDYLFQYEELHSMCPEPFEGIRELLHYLRAKSVKLAMVTGKGKHSTNISLKYFRLNDFFEMIETGSSQGPRKATGIQSVLESWKEIEKDEVIYVGDAISDIEASRKAGVRVIAACWAETAEPEKIKDNFPDQLLFYNVSDFSEWLYERI